MNRHEFYDKLNEYKSLSHSNDYKYYNKIDLGNGKTRYFYTKAEWDAYQEGEARNKYEQQKKTIANNKTASEHEGDRFKKPSKMTNEEKQELTNKARQHIYKIQNIDNNRKAEEAQNAQKQNNSTIAMKKEHPEWFNSKGVYVEPVKDIYAQLNSSSENRSRIYQTEIVDFLWKLRDRTYKDSDNESLENKFAKRKEYVFNKIDEIYNKEDAEKIKDLINNLEDDQRNVIKYMKDAGEDDYYKKKLKPDKMREDIINAINRREVDDRKFRTEEDAVKYVIDKIEDAEWHVFYDFIEKDAKAKDFYKEYVYNIVGRNDELGFRKELINKIYNEVKNEILDNLPEHLIKYLPEKYQNKKAYYS